MRPSGRLSGAAVEVRQAIARHVTEMLDALARKRAQSSGARSVHGYHMLSTRPGFGKQARCRQAANATGSDIQRPVASTLTRQIGQLGYM